jgi:radical SAM protein with 4Fe4S-binding SPASM domain
MIGISKLYCGDENEGDAIRYGKQSVHMSKMPHAHSVPKAAGERRPVVSWNITRTCNLSCVHCYSDSEAKSYEGELTTDEAKTVINDIAQFKSPALLFSGGEPLIRKDVFELVAHARSVGLRSTLSTNGTLIDPETAKRIKESGFVYVGISLDGIGEINDKFRGKAGAFDKAMAAFKNCVAVDQRVGLRLTLTRHNYENLNEIFDFIEREEINRACFYHLVYSGRGRGISGEDLTHEESRHAMDIILDRTEDFHKRGLQKDILTVDNHVDGVYLYMKQLEKNPEKAAETLKMLEWNGGGRYSSGVSFSNIDFYGNVHADQFWQYYSFGNVRERPFSEIWLDQSNPLMKGLKNRLDYIKGRCSVCKWLNACGGSMRVRADAIYSDPFAPDPACYLTDEEIGLTKEKMAALKAKGEEFPVPAHLLEKKASAGAKS